MGLLLPAVAALIVLAIALSVRSGLIRAYEQVKKTKAGIVGALQIRFDVVTAFLSLALHYENYEREMLKGAEKAAASLGREVYAGQALGFIANLGINYPSLRSSEQYQTLMSQLLAIESEIDTRCKIYNESVETLNLRLRGILGSMIDDNLLRIGQQTYLSLKDADDMLPKKIDLRTLGGQAGNGSTSGATASAPPKP